MYMHKFVIIYDERMNDGVDCTGKQDTRLMLVVIVSKTCELYIGYLDV